MHTGEAMPLIEKPSVVKAHGTIPKIIKEFVGAVNTGEKRVSVAKMESPSGWTEPGQTPEFDEWTIVLKGTVRAETRAGTVEIPAGQAFLAPKGQWVRYGTPQGAEYIAVCLPGFNPATVHRDPD